MKRAACLIIVAGLFTACGSPTPPPLPPAAAPKATPAAPIASTPPPSAPSDVPNSPFTVTIVDLNDAPIADVAAIVTENANAFDDPLVRGSISVADGKSDLLIPRDRATFVRGWDPKMNYFANSFLSIDEGDVPLPEGAKVVMAPASSLSAQLYAANGAPLPKDTEVEIMFSHPEEGPWWPAHASTDPSGRFTLEKVPAGKFNIGFHCEGSGDGEVPETVLLPKQPTDLGIVKLN